MTIPSAAVPADVAAVGAAAAATPGPDRRRGGAGTAPETRPVALVTGAARRIGAGIARTLHAAGYDLALHCHRSADEMHALATELEARRAHSVLSLRADLRQFDRLPELVAQAVGRFGRLDALVNNASNFYPTPLGRATPAQWDDLFAVNARAPFFLAQAAVPHLRAAHGAVVNLADIHGERPLPDHPLYSAAKAALLMLTRSLAIELAPEVRVNAIAPGAILWPDADVDAAPALSDGEHERDRPDDRSGGDRHDGQGGNDGPASGGKTDAGRAALLARTPLARTGTPEEIAEAVLWLLRDATYVTGQVIRVDGGRVIG